MRFGDLDLLTLKVVSKSRVKWATSVPILVFLGLSVLDLGRIYATDRRQTASLLNAYALWGGGMIMITFIYHLPLIKPCMKKSTIFCLQHSQLD